MLKNSLTNMINIIVTLLIYSGCSDNTVFRNAAPASVEFPDSNSADGNDENDSISCELEADPSKPQKGSSVLLTVKDFEKFNEISIDGEGVKNGTTFRVVEDTKKFVAIAESKQGESIKCELVVEIDLNQSKPLSPPVFSRFNLKNPRTKSSTFFDITDEINIDLAINSEAGLEKNPITKMEVTYDGVAWQNLNLNNSFFGESAVGAKNWEANVTIPSPTKEFFQLRVFAIDIKGSIGSAVSDSLNVKSWGYFAGRLDDDEGTSSLQAVLGRLNDTIPSQLVVSNLTNDYFIVDVEKGIRKIDHKTLNVETINKTNLANSIIKQDQRGMIYYPTNTGIYRFDPRNPDQVSKYLGGGDKVDTNVTNPNDLLVRQFSKFDFDENNNMYLVVATNENLHVVKEGFKIFKVTQDPETLEASSVSHVFGNGTYAAPTFGQPAINQPANGYYLHHINLAVNRDGTVIYIHTYPWGVWKIISGTLHKTIIKDESSAGTLKFNPFDGKIYFSRRSLNGIFKFAPSLVAEGEIIENVITGGADNSCHENGRTVDNACPLATGGIDFGQSGKMFFVDGTTGNINGRPIRIRSTKINGDKTVVETIAGDDAFNRGNSQNSNKKLARLNSIGSIVVDPLSKTTYFSDPRSLYIFKVKKNSESLEVVTGNGNPLSTPMINVPAANNGLGLPYFGGDIYALGIDRQGHLFYRSRNNLYYIENSMVRPFGEQIAQSGVNLADLSDGDTFKFVGGQSNFMHVNMGLGNIEFDQGNNPYFFSGYAQTSGWHPRITKAEKDTFNISSIAGKWADAVSNRRSPDGALAGDSTIQCTLGGSWERTASRNDACWRSSIRYYDKLYFSEVDRIRSIDEDGKLQTLKDDSGNPITNLSPSFYNFSIVGKRLFYSANGKLFCRWTGLPEKTPLDCQNESVGPPTGFPNLSPQPSIGMAALDNVLMIATDRVILRYDIPE